MNTAHIALGSNIGDRISYLGKAILYLCQHPQITLQRMSSIYETEPVGYLDQEHFYNMVIQIETSLPADRLLQILLEVEHRLDRVRTIVNGPRTVDLDLLYYNDSIINGIDLVVPHPRLHERAFVLVPLTEIAPNFMHPILLRSNRELLAQLPTEGVFKLDFYSKS